MTPAPLQPRLELWTAGEWPDDARRLVGRGPPRLAARRPRPARRRARAPAATRLAARRPRADLRAWRPERALGPALSARLARGATTSLPASSTSCGPGATAFGQDWAVVRGTAADAATIGADVRPLVQLDRLPVGIEAHWALRYDQPIGRF